MALFIIIFPKFVITIIAGAQYADAVPILQLYMIINLINPMQNQAANTLNSIGKAQLVFKLDAISLLMNLCINYVCLSIWGFYGAAIGTFITCVINSFIWYFTMKKLINLHLPNVYGHIIGSYKMVYAEAVSILKGKKA
jgi:O-antigen/teichoic acid export membrane protein